jgi:flagellar hook protein FlgE
MGLTTELVDKTARSFTDLRDLDSNVHDYVAGDVVEIVAQDYDGTNLSGTFTFGEANDGTTVGDLVTKLNDIFVGTTAALTTDGDIAVTADTVGSTDLFLSLTDADTNTDGTQFTNHTFSTTVQGGLGDTRSTAIEIYDEMGGSHTLNVIFRKEGVNEWSATASVPTAEGTMLDNKIEGIRFGEDGSLSQITGTGIGDPGFEVRFSGIATPQMIQLDLGSSGAFDGLTQYGSNYSAVAVGQDGYGPGSLRSISVKSDGTIEGNFSNGKITEIAQLQVATFSNPPGMLKHGDNLYLPGANSGPPVPGTALSGSAGRISSTSLEMSNVDIALEFTRLITAQRGFQVNARTITTTDELMQELANIIR